MDMKTIVSVLFVARRYQAELHELRAIQIKRNKPTAYLNIDIELNSNLIALFESYERLHHEAQ